MRIGFLATVVAALLTAGCGSGEGSEASGGFDATASAQAETQTLASGLVFTEVLAGEGAAPGPRDTVVVHYHGTFPDGKVFDSSLDRGTPARFPLDRVIPCWTEALQKMREGGRARLVCPPEIAYGARGGGPIPPNATLHFDVELIEVAR